VQFLQVRQIELIQRQALVFRQFNRRAGDVMGLAEGQL